MSFYDSLVFDKATLDAAAPIHEQVIPQGIPDGFSSTVVEQIVDTTNDIITKFNNSMNWWNS